MDMKENIPQQSSSSSLCVNNCGFFGNPTTFNLCSKCFSAKKKRKELEDTTPEKASKIQKIEQPSSTTTETITQQLLEKVEVPISSSSTTTTTIQKEIISTIVVESIDPPITTTTIIIPTLLNEEKKNLKNQHLIDVVLARRNYL